MTFSEQSLIIIFSITLIIIIMIIYSYYRIKRINLVKENSLMYKELTKLKSSFSFNNITTYYSFTDSHSKKNKFDKDTPAKYMSRHVFDNLDFYNEIQLNIKDNMYKYRSFLSSYFKLESTIGRTNSRDFSKLKIEKFIKIEKRLFIKSKIKQPTTSFNIKYMISYTSPKGRNHYVKNNTYNNYEIEIERMNVQYQIKNRSIRQYTIKKERSKMTSGLRYNILERDNFRCQICGSTQSDDVKLHVDHITPVSKGGLTIFDNLRTLCDRCNSGKSNK